jgi:hypothetical protein
VPLPASDFDRRQPECVFVAVVGNSVANDNAGIADCARDSQYFETALRKITKRVEVVHFVADIKKSVFRIVAGRRRADDHSGGVHAVTDNAIGGGCVTAERSEIGNGESRLALSPCKPYEKDANRS